MQRLYGFVFFVVFCVEIGRRCFEIGRRCVQRLYIFLYSLVFGLGGVFIGLFVIGDRL